MITAFIALLGSVRASSGDPRILSATYGLAGCLGVDTRDADALRLRGCVVTASGETSARSVLQMDAFCGGKRIDAADGLPVTFSEPIDTSTLKAEYFEFTLNNGTVTKALCASPKPAGEPNELQTIATVGYYGDGWNDTVYPVSVRIVGALAFADGRSAQNLSFNIAPEHRFAVDAPFMVQAQISTFSDDGEAGAEPILPKVYPNHCGKLFPSVTHRLRIVLNGGGTLDGVHSVLPNATDLFEILDNTGAPVTAPVLGLADLGAEQGSDSLTYKHDGDNYYDVCLDASRGSVDAIATVRMPCDAVKLVLPKGRPACANHSIPVEAEEL